MIIRALDSNWDWTFGQGKQNYLRGNQAIGQNIKSRLWCFLRDCFWAQNLGIDWKRYMSVPTPPQEVVLSVRAMVLQSTGVIKLNDLSVSQPTSRSIIIDINVKTENSPEYQQNVENLPFN